MVRDGYGRSLVKAVTYRLLGTLATALIVFALTSRFTIAVAASGVELVFKGLLFFLHERLWSRIHWGSGSS